MSDDSYHPEDEISPTDRNHDEENDLEEIAKLMPLPEMITMEDYPLGSIVHLIRRPVTPSPGTLSKSITGK